MVDAEVLVIRGYLDRAGRFTGGRSRSTRHVRQWPVVEKSDVVVELVDGKGVVLHREYVEVRPVVECEPGDARQFRVVAYIALRNDARTVRLRRDDLLIWDRVIPEPARLKARLGRRAKDAFELELNYSEPGQGANMLVVYQWGEGRFQPVYVGQPQERLRIPRTGLPGGEACRFAVTYSNGLRSAVARTAAFNVARLGPFVEIFQPAVRAAVQAGVPVILEGSVTDPERRGGPRFAQEVVWRVDGQEVGRGLIASVDGLEEGTHEIEFAYLAEPGASKTVEVNARRSRRPTANSWPDWDPLAR